MASCGKRLQLNWKLIFVIVLPLVLLPLLFIHVDVEKDKEGNELTDVKFRAAYVIILVALYWMCEALPLAVSALIPIILFPLFGVLSTSSVSQAYMKETNMMFLGGLIIALAVEHCYLHRRIALRVMTVVGSSPIRLMAGTMLTTMFLSMWMSNTATAAIMVPIVLAIIDELHHTPASRINNQEGRSLKRPSKEMPLEIEADFANSGDGEIVPEDLKSKKELLQAKKMYLFAVAYSASIGGTGVITGTVPNLVFQDIVVNNDRFDITGGGKHLPMVMSFAIWMAFNVPAMLLNLLVAFIYLTFQFHGIPNWKYFPIISRFSRKEILTQDEQLEQVRQEKVTELLMSEYKKLGPLTFHETGVGCVFFITVMLWLFRDPGFMPGWNGEINKNRLEKMENGDATAAMIGVLLMFVIPRDLTFILGNPTPGQKPKALLDWKFVQENLPWGVVLLLGAGFALSDASDKSGLSGWIGDQLSKLEHLPNPVILIIVMSLTTIVTEVCSNTATANVVLPILLSLSESLGIHPLYLTLPATVTCSFAFMLPVATPPNAIVFAAGDLKIIDMVKAGAFLNVACTLVFFLVNISYGELLFNYSDYTYPIKNITTSIPTSTMMTVG